MKRDALFIGLAVLLAVFLVGMFSNFSTEKFSLTGNVVDGNITSDSTINETSTNSTTNETILVTNETIQDTNITVNETSTNSTTNETILVTNETIQDTNITVNVTVNETTNSSGTNITETNTTSVDDNSNVDTTEITDTIDTTEITDTIDTTEITDTTTVTETTTTGLDDILKQLEANQQKEQPVDNPPPETNAPEDIPEVSNPSLTGSAISDQNQTCDEGCFFDNKCYSVNDRRRGEYCSEDKSWIKQKDASIECSSDFECLSNSCSVDNICDVPNLFQKIIFWLIDLFNGANNSTAINISLNSTI